MNKFLFWAPQAEKVPAAELGDAHGAKSAKPLFLGDTGAGCCMWQPQVRVLLVALRYPPGAPNAIMTRNTTTTLGVRRLQTPLKAAARVHCSVRAGAFRKRRRCASYSSNLLEWRGVFFFFFFFFALRVVPVPEVIVTFHQRLCLPRAVFPLWKNALIAKIVNPAGI